MSRGLIVCTWLAQACALEVQSFVLRCIFAVAVEVVSTFDPALKKNACILLSSYIAGSNLLFKMKDNNQLRLLRHATMLLEMNGITILIDPMLSAKNEMDPVQNCGNDIRIPMVDLPIDEVELNETLRKAAAVFVTHTHRDHWDDAAQKQIDKRKPIFCQPSDENKIREQGFKDVNVIVDEIVWNDIMIHRTPGQHGTGEIGKKMGVVSGFIFDDGTQKIYLAGDTIWCDEVEETLVKYKPDVIVVNAGGAQFSTGGPITMTPEHILDVYKTLPQSKLIAIHMDTVNHCFVKRKDLISFLKREGLESKINIPLDGEEIKFYKSW